MFKPTKVKNGMQYDKTPIHLRIDQAQKLKRLSVKYGVSKQEIIRQMLDHCFKTRN